MSVHCVELNELIGHPHEFHVLDDRRRAFALHVYVDHTKRVVVFADDHDGDYSFEFTRKIPTDDPQFNTQRANTPSPFESLLRTRNDAMIGLSGSEVVVKLVNVTPDWFMEYAFELALGEYMSSAKTFGAKFFVNEVLMPHMFELPVDFWLMAGDKKDRKNVKYSYHKIMMRFLRTKRVRKFIERYYLVQPDVK